VEAARLAAGEEGGVSDIVDLTKSRGILPKRRFWLADEVEQLRRLYADTPTKKIAEQLQRDVKGVYVKAAELGLKKSAAYLAGPHAYRLRRGGGVGTATRFKPGQTPWNKGSHYVAGGRSAETRFKSGHRGGRAVQVYQPIGAERISKDGYLQRKVNDDLPFQRRWRFVHVLLWERHHGPVPKGHAIVFRDGDKRNLVIENLDCVSRQELMRRNTVHRLPKEFAELVQLRGALNRQINARSRKE
jgi:hypothetical protein